MEKNICYLNISIEVQEQADTWLPFLWKLSLNFFICISLQSVFTFISSNYVTKVQPSLLVKNGTASGVAYKLINDMKPQGVPVHTLNLNKFFMITKSRSVFDEDQKSVGSFEHLLVNSVHALINYKGTQLYFSCKRPLVFGQSSLSLVCSTPPQDITGF